MDLVQFASSLLPRFTRDRALEDARVTATELKTVSIAAYKEAELGLKKVDFKSSQVKEFEKTYKRIVKGGGSMIESIRSILEDTAEVVSEVEKRLEKEFEKDITSAGISAKRAGVLQVLETCTFISGFSYTFLNHFYIYETALLNKDSQDYIRDNLSPVQIDYVNMKFHEFCGALAVIDKNGKNFNRLMDTIPDVDISGNNASALVATVGAQKLDPMGLSTVSAGILNPIYHIRLMVAEWQADRYKVAVETKKSLELRLLNLQMQSQGQFDAGMEKEINYIQGRINKLSKKINDMEESVNG